MSDVRIRPAEPAELDDVGRITETAYDHNGYLTMADGRYDEAYASWLRDGAGRAAKAVVLVAIIDDSVVGTVTWCATGSSHRELATADDQGEFRSLAVLPTVRGHGVGRALVSHCLGLARRDGLREVVISSLPDMTPAHRLYESLGFSRREELDWSPFDGVLLWGFSATL